MPLDPDIQQRCSLIDPNERLKHLINYSNAVEVDFHIPPTRYYRSGLEMVRMANVYYNEGSLENAYVLYLKFMTLFLEKIRKHPEFNSVPLKVKANNQALLREVLPKAEKLKEKLLQQYKEEYNRYAEELEEKKKKDLNRKNDKDLDSMAFTCDHSFSSAHTGSYADVKTPFNVNNISYPDPNFQPTVSSPKQDSIPTSDLHVPSIDRSSKPSSTFSTFHRKDFLRTVVVPENLMSQFENISQRNTVKNVETCGILAGNLANDQLIITHIILPKQKGTSDSCTTMNEEEIFDFQDQSNLITLGWIHTHPTQTAFLSSVDLHTHCPYQLLLPEAIAIVCAPRYNETAFFMLTPNYGLQFIASCTKSGFHPHPTNPPLFGPAEHVIVKNSPLEILDLRSDK